MCALRFENSFVKRSGMRMGKIRHWSPMIPPDLCTRIHTMFRIGGMSHHLLVLYEDGSYYSMWHHLFPNSHSSTTKNRSEEVIPIGETYSCAAVTWNGFTTCWKREWSLSNFLELKKQAVKPRVEGKWRRKEQTECNNQWYLVLLSFVARRRGVRP